MDTDLLLQGQKESGLGNYIKSYNTKLNIMKIIQSIKGFCNSIKMLNREIRTAIKAIKEFDKAAETLKKLQKK